MEERNKTKEALIRELRELTQAHEMFIRDRANMEFELRERKKELNCHNRLSEIMGNTSLGVEEVLLKVVEAIPQAWQFPQIAEAAIRVNKMACQTRNFVSTRWSRKKNLTAFGKIIGSVEVCYLESPLFDPLHPFLKEEDDLIAAIAERLSTYMEGQQVNAALIDSEQKYKNLIENISDVIYETDARANITYISPAITKLLGYKPEEIIGKNFLVFVGDNADFLKNRFSELEEKGEIEHIYKIVSKSGEEHWLRFSTKALMEDGVFKGGTGTLVDVTRQKQAELNYLESVTLYQSILNASPDVIVITDLDGKIRFGSPSAVPIFGLNQVGDAVGHNFAEFLHESSLPKAITNFARMFELPLGIEEYKGIRSDGSLLDFEVNGDIIRDSDGQPTGMVFVIRDITERKITEEKLSKSEETFRHLVETVNDAIYEITSEGIINYVSPAIERIVGYTPDELIGRNFFQFMYPDDRPILLEALQKLGDKDFSYLEYRYLTKEGQIRWVRSSTTPILKEGNVVGGTGSLTNINELKLAENELRKLSRAVEQSPVSIVITDLDGNIEYANPKATETTGYSLDELKGKNPRVLKSGETSAEDYTYLWNSISTGHQWSGIFHNKKKSGEYYWESSVITPILDQNGKITNYLAIKEDITEKRNIELELAASEKRFRQVAEQSMTVIWEVNNEGLYTFVSPVAKTVWGYAPEELVDQMHFYDLHPEEGREAFKKEALAVFEKRDSFKNLVNPIITKRKNVIWVSTNGEPILDSQNNLIGYRGADNDITEKKLAEEQIKDQNEKLSAIVRAMPDLLFVIDQQGYFHEYYATTPEGLLVPAEQIIGTNLRSIFNRETGDLHLNMISKCIQIKGLVTYEYSIAVDQVVVYFEARMTPVGDERVLVFVRDITEKRQKDDQLKKLSLAVEQSPVSIVITDLEANIEYVNPSFEETSGYCRDEVIGQSTKILKSGLTMDATYKDMWETITAGREWQNEWVNKKKNGDLYWESIQITPIHNENNVVTNYLAVKQDITQRKRAETEIRDLNINLEHRINQRTAQLNDANKELQREIEERKTIEQALLDKTNELENFFYLTLDLLVICDLRGNFVKANRAWEIMLGVSVAELENRNVAEFLHPDDVEMTFNVISSMSEEKPVLDFVNRYRSHDGAYLFIEWQAVVKNGLIYAAARDITERKQAQLLLEQTRQNYLTFFHTIDELLWVIHPDGNIIATNETVNQRLGYSSEELFNEPIVSFFAPERREEARKLTGSMLGDVLAVCTAPLVSKTGLPIPMETRVRKGFWDGKSVIYCISKDISEIQLSEQKFATAFHFNSAMMAISYFEGGQYVDVNNTFTDTMGYSREEMLGKTNAEMGLFVDPYLRSQLLHDLANNVLVRKKEVLFRTKDGSIKTGLLSADSIFIGNQKCFLTVTIDITERKQMEDELRKARYDADRANASKSEFLSRMSHELRTPMNSILGFAQLLEMGELNSGQKKGVGHIIKSGKHLLDLINEVLDISRIEAGRLSLSLEPVLVKETIQEMMDVVRIQAREKGITIELVESPDNNIFVRSDRQRLKQVLLNLINNAIKYNRPDGAIILKIEARGQAGRDSRLVRVVVMDTGMGIDQEDIPKLFKPFERVGAEKTSTEGTGLGLAVVKKLVEAMGGQIGVESMPGVGSSFWFELPELKSPIEALKESGYAERSGSEMGDKSGTILYIEDNLSNIELVEQILSSQRGNLRLCTTTTGKSALKMAIEHKPDLILLDLNLPDIHGSTVIRHLQTNERTADIPVVIISADAMPHQLERLMKAGAKDYLTKPLDVSLFIKTVDKYLNI